MGNGSSFVKYFFSDDNYVEENSLYSNDIKTLRLVASYCPHTVLRFLENKTLTEPISLTITGACLLADICGFTKFSGDLCKQGVSGIDILRRTTSTFLTKFIEIIYFYYGDVMAFAGDALICVFAPRPEDNNDPSKCCLRAVLCGNELKQLKTNTLSAHIAIDYGPGRLAFLGGYENNWTYIYDGECFACLGHCINEAAVQELVISSTLSKELESCSDEETKSLTFKRLSSGNFLIGTVEVKDKNELSDPELVNEKLMRSLMVDKLKAESLRTRNKQLYSFIPAPVLRYLQQSEPLRSLDAVSSSAELRRVTCLFLKFDSYIGNYPLEDLQNCFYNWQEIILRYGGYIRQIVTDDKGCVLIALWGVPTASHVNDAIRALAAVSEISAFCLQNNYRVSMGVTTGDVFCGMIGSNSRCDYAAVGSSINFAARLMAKSKGKIFLDEPTNYLLQTSTPDCSKKLTPMHFKGRSEAVQVYQFLDANFRNSSGHRLNTNTFAGVSDSFTTDSPTPFNFFFDDASSASRSETRTSPNPDPSFVGLDTLMKLNKCISTLNHWHGTAFIVDEEDKELFEGSYITKPIEENCVQVVYVSGTSGTGKTEVAAQLTHLCSEQKIKTISLSLTELDAMIEYQIIRHIFVQYFGESHYQDINLQKQLITTLFFETYPLTTKSTVLQGKFECLREVLGLTWYPIELKIKTRFSVSKIRMKIKGEESMSMSMDYEPQDPLSVILELFVTMFRSAIPLTIIIDETQYCDAASWSIIFHILTHLRAPIIFMFTVTEPRKSPDELTKDSEDYQQTKRSDSVAFLTTEHNSSDRKKRFADNPISSMDPFGDGSPVQVTQRMKLLDTLRYYSKLTTIKLHGLSKRQVRILLQQSLSPQNITAKLLNIVTQICEGNVFWCKVIIDFIVQYGEDSFCKTFCTDLSEDLLKSPTRTTAPLPQAEPTPRLYRPSPKTLEAKPDELQSISQDEEFSFNKPNTTEAESNGNTAADNVLYRLVTTLMDRLSYQEKEILKYASVCGAKFHSELLKMVLSPSLSEQCDNILHSLNRYKFITSCRGRMNYSFISYRMRDIIYSLIPCSDASAMHYNVAKQMEILYCHSLETFYEVLTFHYTMASSSPFQIPREEFFLETIPTSFQQIANPSPTTLSRGNTTPNSRFSWSQLITAVTTSAATATTPTPQQHHTSPTITSSVMNLTPSSPGEDKHRTTTYSSYMLTIHEIVKKKSYEYSFFSAKYLYRLQEYHRAVDYITYATQADAMELLGDGYRQGILRFLTNWITQSKERTTDGQSQQRISSQRLSDGTLYSGLLETVSTIRTLLNSLQS